MQPDEQNLNLLVIFHYALAVMAALFSCFALIFVVIGLAALFHPEAMSGGRGEPPPPFFGWIFTSMGTAFLIMTWVYVVCLVLAGRFIKRRKYYVFCLVVAGLSCMWAPFGTVLGVFTFVILLKPEVKALFEV